MNLSSCVSVLGHKQVEATQTGPAFQHCTLSLDSFSRNGKFQLEKTDVPVRTVLVCLSGKGVLLATGENV